MSEENPQSTLRDYLITIRRRRRPILVILLAGLLAGLGVSLIQERTYTAEASFRVKDLSESLSLAGLLPRTGDLPAVTAAQGAEAATTARVVERVREKLKLEESPEEIQSRISALQEPQSNLITVSADAPTPEKAADLANSVASSAVDVGNERTRAQLDQLAENLRAKAEKLGGEAPRPGADPSALQDIVDETTQRRVLSDQAARLQGVATVADVGDVAEEATPPKSPSSPKTIQNTIIGGVFGLFIGLFAAGILESLDRRLRRPEDAQRILGIPLIGIVPENAMGGVPTEGTPADQHVAAMDAFRMMQTNLAFLDRAGTPKTVLVTSPLPEEGKTTVATGLAMASAISGQQTLLVEADFHRPVHAARLGIDPEPGLVDYLVGEARPKQVVQALQFTDPAAGSRNGDSEVPSVVLACITAGSRDLWSAEMLGFERFTAFLASVQKVYDLVVIDSGPLLAVAETLQLIPMVDAVTFCVRLGQTTRELAMAGKESLDRLPERQTGLVTTGVTADESDGYSYYAYAYNYRFGHEKPHARHQTGDTVSSRQD